MSLQSRNTFVHNLRAIQHKSRHHSIHQEFILRESMTSQRYKPVPSELIPDFPELVSDFKFSRSEIPVLNVLPLPESLETWIQPLSAHANPCHFLHVRHDFPTRIFKSSKAVGVENQMFLKFLRYQRLQTGRLDLVVHLTLSHLLALRHRGLPAFKSRLEFEKRASLVRNKSMKKLSLPSSCCGIRPLLQSSPTSPRGSSASWQPCIGRSAGTVCICCKMNSRFCTPRSWFVMIGRNFRSMNSVEIPVICSVDHSKAAVAIWTHAAT